jgi:4-oxalomesaconate tautomerase
VTLIDNGMPCVVMKAQDVGITGYEDRDWLDAPATWPGSRRSGWKWAR